MDISNSTLFKNLARPVLQQLNGFGDEDAPQSPTIMDAIVQYLFDRSKLRVSLVEITDPSDDAFTIYVEARVTQTGPVSSTVSSEALDMTFNGCKFGTAKVPSLTTSFWGADVSMPAQRVQITDLTTFQAYVRSTILLDETSFGMGNGKCEIKALGLTMHCDYNLEIPMVGMAGPQATIIKMSHQGDNIAVTARVHNPSPVVIDYGVSIFELRSRTGETLASLKGHLKVVRGDFDFVIEGKLSPGVVLDPDENLMKSKLLDKARFVGVGVEGVSGWCQHTVQYIDVPVKIGK